jgi:hypothetical protein
VLWVVLWGRKDESVHPKKVARLWVGGAERALGIGQPQVDRNYALCGCLNGRFSGQSGSRRLIKSFPLANYQTDKNDQTEWHLYAI